MTSENLGFDDDFMETMMSDFLDESEVYLTNLNDKLGIIDQVISSADDESETSYDPDILNEMFRDAHSLKGLSAMLRLGNVNSLTHRIENLFDAARDNKLTITKDVVELLFEGFDRLSGMVENLKSVGNDDVEFETVADAIQQILDNSNLGTQILTKEEMQSAISNDLAADANAPNTSPPASTSESASESDETQTPPISQAPIEVQEANSSAAPLTDDESESSQVQLDALKDVSESDTVSSGVETGEAPQTREASDPFNELIDEDEIPPKYLSIFIDETNESVDILSECLFADPSEIEINAILIRCHQIKGSAASIGLQRPAKLAHVMEDILQELRDSGNGLSQAVADALSFATDSIRSYVEQLTSDTPTEDNFTLAYHGLRDSLNAPEANESIPPTDDSSAAEIQSASTSQEALTETPIIEDASEADNPDRSSEITEELQATAEPFEQDASPEDGVQNPDTIPPLSEQSGSETLAAGEAFNEVTAAEELPGFQSSVFHSEERKQLTDSAPLDRDSIIGVVLLQEGLALAEIKAQLVFNRLESAGQVFFRSPTEDELDQGEHTRLLFGVATDQGIQELRQNIDLDGITKISLETISARPQDTLADAADSNIAGETTSGTIQSVAPEAATSPVSKPGIEPAVSNQPSGEISQSDLEVAAALASLTAVASQATSPTPAPSANTLPPAGRSAPRAATDKPTSAARPPAEAAKQKPAETLRVDIERLDQLMNLAGQLVINRARFGQIHEKLKSLSANKQASTRIANLSTRVTQMLNEATDTTPRKKAGSDVIGNVKDHAEHLLEDLETLKSDVQQLGQARTLINQLSDAVHQLERISDGIQQSVMDTRMVPIGPLFSRFKRVIRDITRMNGKNVQLVIRGEKTELDKRMIDELADPLIHMVRNSADHGIETPAEREALGKPEQGTVTLDAFHRGNRVLIKIHDDGRGLNPDKLKEKAISKGIITDLDAERMSAQEALQLIWEPGFSTAETITEISGRGMGMDIVRSKIEQLNGTVELSSEIGVGTTIIIKLPLTMAILPSLLFIIEGDVYAVPVESVIEIVRIRTEEMPTVHGALTARFRNRVIPVVGMDRLFHWNDKYLEAREKPNELTLVIIGSDGFEIGLTVDHLIGEEDIVVKSLAENYRNVNGLSGASILGDGSVSLILDVSALMEMSRRKNSAA